jgi:hypothetical protein
VAARHARRRAALDAVHALVDERATHVLEEMAQEVDRLSSPRPAADAHRESDLNDPGMVTPPGGGGTGITAQWSDDFHHALHSTLTGEGQGYYGDFADAGLRGLAKDADRRLLPRRRLVELPPPAPRPAGRHRAAAGLEVPRLPAGPRPDRQPRRR